jgi:integrase
VASVAEVDRVAGEMPDRLRVGVLLAAWCQMRRGEMLALQRCHVDLLHGTIRIEQAWVVPPKGRPVVGPKTEAGRRTVAVPPNILPAVEEHLEQFVGPEPKAWLFGTSTGTAISPRNFQRYWDKARDAIGRPDLHLHDLRHTGLTWATHLFGDRLPNIGRGAAHFSCPVAAGWRQVREVSRRHARYWLMTYYWFMTYYDGPHVLPCLDASCVLLMGKQRKERRRSLQRQPPLARLVRFVLGRRDDAAAWPPLRP